MCKALMTLKKLNLHELLAVYINIAGIAGTLGISSVPAIIHRLVRVEMK